MNATTTPQEVAPQTALTIVDRARTALAVTPERDVALIALAAKSIGIVRITNTDGYKEAHSARMILKTERIAIEKSGKAARDDAVKFSKAVIAEEARLVSLIEPEEKRLQALQDAEDARVEAERNARIRAEADRVAAIRKRIDWIRAHVVEFAGKPAAAIGAAAATLESLPVTVELYAELLDEGARAKADTLSKLAAMRAQAVANEVEAARKADDDARAARQAEQDAERRRLQKIEDDRVAAAWAEAERQDAIALEQREREETVAAAERKRAREALEAAADPWAALTLIAAKAGNADPESALADCGDIERIASAAMEAREEMEKAAV